MNITNDEKITFWSRIKIDTDDKCWEWQAGKAGNGYGSFWIKDKKTNVGAHRIAYLLSKGEVPIDKPVICHTCDNRCCCNPKHLFCGTTNDNIQDMVKKKRHSHGEKHSKAKINPAKGFDNGMRVNPPKLTMELARIIRKETGTHQFLGDKYGVSRRMIGMIKDNTRWAD